MTSIIEFVVALAICIILWKIGHFFIKRFKLASRFKTLKKVCKAKISLQKSIFKPMWRTDETPDAIIEIADTVYLVRIYNGGGGMRSVHFATEEYSCVYLRLRASARAPQGTGASSLAMSSGINISAKVYRIPAIKIPSEYEADGRKVERVLLLNPAPAVLSYVTEAKNSVRIAFTGDELWGVKVFTADTFARYAERMMREDERLARDNPDEYEYFFNR